MGKLFLANNFILFLGRGAGRDKRAPSRCSHQCFAIIYPPLSCMQRSRARAVLRPRTRTSSWKTDGSVFGAAATANTERKPGRQPPLVSVCGCLGCGSPETTVRIQGRPECPQISRNRHRQHTSLAVRIDHGNNTAGASIRSQEGGGRREGKTSDFLDPPD